MNEAELELQKIIEVIKRTVSPQRIVLFGSRAKGCEKKESDFDLFCLMANNKNTRILEKKAYVELTKAGIGSAVDLIVESEKIYDQNKDNPFMIFFEISRFGKTVYEKEAAA